MSLVIQRGVIFDDLIVEHDQVLHDLTARPGCLKCLLILRNLIQQRVYLVELVLITQVSLTLLLLLVVLINGSSLPLKGFNDHIDAIVCVLHDQTELLLRIRLLIIIPPDEGDAVGVVKVSLDSLK